MEKRNSFCSSFLGNRIDNPINYRPPNELLNDVTAFYESHHLSQELDVELLQRGALLARDRERFLREAKYDDVEKRALEEEENPKLSRQPKELQVVLLACAIGAVVQ